MSSPQTTRMLGLSAGMFVLLDRPVAALSRADSTQARRVRRRVANSETHRTTRSTYCVNRIRVLPSSLGRNRAFCGFPAHAVDERGERGFVRGEAYLRDTASAC